MIRIFNMDGGAVVTDRARLAETIADAILDGAEPVEVSSLDGAVRRIVADVGEIFDAALDVIRAAGVDGGR